MAGEFETTSLVVKTTKNSCVVSVSIGSNMKNLSFSKSKFYFYGLQCDGEMTNLLEDGMEVQISYKILANNTPQIVIAWLGDRPEVIEEEKTMNHPVYDQQGVFSGLWQGDFVVGNDCGKVLINKTVFFRDGQQCATITTDDEVWFDAVPMEDVHPSGAVYNATCAWVGKLPTISDRFGNQLKTGEGVKVHPDVVHGTVVVVPSEVVAVVDVELESSSMKVMVFRSSFIRACDRIQDVLEVGDRLCMGLAYGYVFPGKKQWFAQVALKVDLDEVGAGRSGSDNQIESASTEDEDLGKTLDGESEDLENGVISEEDLVKTTSDESEDATVGKDEDSVIRLVGGSEDLMKAAVCDGEDSVKTGIDNSQDLAKAEVSEGEDSVKTAVCEREDSVKTVVDEGDVVLVLYKHNPPLTGVLSRLSSKCVITYGDSKIYLDESNFYEDGKRGSFPSLKSHASSGKKKVKFEAVSMNRADEKYAGFSHEAVCAWLGDAKPTLRSVAFYLPPSNLNLTKEKYQVFYGIVAKFCFPWIALVKIPGLTTTVSAHRRDFISKPVFHKKGQPGGNLISSFVKLEDCVQFKVMVRYGCSQLLCAVDVKRIECSKEMYDDVSSGRLSRVAIPEKKTCLK